MALGELISRRVAEEVAYEVLRHLNSVTQEIMIAGSLRRMRPMVHDVDLVIIPTTESQKIPEEFGVEAISPWNAKVRELVNESRKEIEEKKLDFEVKHGDKIISFIRKGVPVDIYVATPENYSCLCLIRTGSSGHNTKLAGIAKANGWQLKASGEGLVDLKDGKVLETTEKGILQRLLGRYVVPEDRE